MGIWKTYPDAIEIYDQRGRAVQLGIELKRIEGLAFAIQLRIQIIAD